MSGASSVDVFSVRGMTEKPAFERPNASASSIDDVECARGAISALSYVSPFQAREVHTNSIRNLFDRAGRVTGYRYGLAALQLVGEIQQLPGGYWLPTPVRTVPLLRQALVVAPTTTARLQHEFPGVRRAGLARVAAADVVSTLPEQDLDGWLGQSCYDARAWGSTELSTLVEQMRPTVSHLALEYFHVTSESKAGQRTTRFSWINEPKTSLPDRQDMYLCRERVGRQSYRHCLISRGKGVIRAEASVPYSPTRLQYAIAAMQGNAIRICFSETNEMCRITFSESLPRAEFRLLAALGKKVAQSHWQRVYEMEAPFAPVVLERLACLGCEKG
jgi:hypothetical protein